MSSSGIQPAARYFGQTSPQELKDLEKNAVKATDKQMAKAASYLQIAFAGQYYAWFGGWALKLRGSRRDTKDLDLLVVAEDVCQVRATLAPYSWAILNYWEISGSIQERMFVDVGEEEEQVVGVDIVLSGALDTPDLREPGSFALIKPSFRTPQGDSVSVIELDWQVECKLKTWMSRKKESDFQDLQFLFENYEEVIREWSEHLNMDWRVEFYEVYKAAMDDPVARERMRKTLSLSCGGQLLHRPGIK
ncbi:hypothetical protein F4808DRAFT_236120 [Astrocystis sublimbata]|nr:hypothetical protein F4808DRAFT_236120 [Astrocystis sublimbata]